MLPAFGFPLAFLPYLHGAVEHRQQLRALRAEGIKRPGLDEAFQNTFVQEAQIHMLAKFHQVLKSPQLLPRCQHRFDGRGTDVLDGRQSKANGVAGGVKTRSLELTSGGRIPMPISLHSAR